MKGYIMLKAILSISTCILLSLVGTGLTAAEGAQGNATDDQMVDLAEIDGALRRGQFDHVCSIAEDLLQFRSRLTGDEESGLIERWQMAAMRKALLVKDDKVERYVALTDAAEHPLMQPDNPRRRLLQQEIKEIAEHWLVRKEQAVIAQYKGLQNKERMSSGRPGRLREVADSYSSLAERFPDSPTGRKAATDAERIRSTLPDDQE
ncbi:MAG: hypothetical protein ACOCXJ_06030 [Planctomycetota bacterium]